MELARVIQCMRMFKRAGEMYDAALSACAAACGILRQEADVLVFLANNPESNTAREVAEQRGYSKAYVSKAVEGLLARGYITAAVSEADRRIQRLCVTAAAADTVCALQDAQRGFAACLTNGVSERDRETFWTVAETFADNIIKRSGR